MSVLHPNMVYEYINGRFEGGLVEGSVHPENTIYFGFRRSDDESESWFHEITVGEGAAIMACIAHAILATESDVEPIPRLDVYDKDEDEEVCLKENDSE